MTTGKYMKFTRIYENDNFIVDYDTKRKLYRVSYFENGHFKDEIWFDAYEEKEASMSEALNDYALKNYTLLECNLSEEELDEIIDKFYSVGHSSFFITPDGYTD